jgi:hypothetical protein
VKVGGRPPRQRGYSDENPSRLQVVQHITDPVGAGEADPGDLGDVHGLAATQHHLGPPPGHTDPELRRTIRSSRLPSWLVMSRTRTRSATLPPRNDPTSPGVSHQQRSTR